MKYKLNFCPLSCEFNSNYKTDKFCLKYLYLCFQFEHLPRQDNLQLHNISIPEGEIQGLTQGQPGEGEGGEQLQKGAWVSWSVGSWTRVSVVQPGGTSLSWGKQE